jgi:hypothetical protein
VLRSSARMRAFAARFAARSYSWPPSAFRACSTKPWASRRVSRSLGTRGLPSNCRKRRSVSSIPRWASSWSRRASAGGRLAIRGGLCVTGGGVGGALGAGAGPDAGGGGGGVAGRADAGAGGGAVTGGAGGTGVNGSGAVAMGVVAVPTRGSSEVPGVVGLVVGAGRAQGGKSRRNAAQPARARSTSAAAASLIACPGRRAG